MDLAIVLNGLVGLVLGSSLIAHRDRCAEVLGDVLGIPLRWSAVATGTITGSGLALLVAAAWTIHSTIAA